MQKAQIIEDLKKKMVFIVGPRQSGKTWLAKQISRQIKPSVYLNYDSIPDRQIISTQSWLPNTKLLIFDELHKMPNWKNFLKGVYDTKKAGLQILVTGSARLDIYDKVGDSLAGRYYRHRLLPFSLAEFKKVKAPVNLKKILKRGGFPEPYLSDSSVDMRRWRDLYFSNLLSTDIFEIDAIQNVKALNNLINILRHRVGATVSYQNISRDLEVSPTTIKKYISLLESLFIIFKVTPYTNKITRSIIKEPKIYFYDNGMVHGEGAKLENLVAFSILKQIMYYKDSKAKSYELNYIRTKDGKEVDFAISMNRNVTQIIEVKSRHVDTKNLEYFKKKYDFFAIQVVKDLNAEFVHRGIQILKVKKYLCKPFLSP